MLSVPLFRLIILFLGVGVALKFNWFCYLTSMVFLGGGLYVDGSSLGESCDVNDFSLLKQGEPLSLYSSTLGTSERSN